MTLTQLPLVPHIYVNDLGSIGSGKGLSPGRRQAIAFSNGDLLSIWPSGTNFGEIWLKKLNF